jgi:cation diffusion facilitator CzcD-associated flavoprotein CzcO
MSPEPRELDVLVIGAGASGVGAAIVLAGQGVDDVVVLEKAPRSGGTWRDNTYPGCACDVPSLLYSYSFAANPGWSRVFARQPEIQAYLQDVADRHGVTPKIAFGTEVLRMDWDAAAGRWDVETSGVRYRPRVVLAGSGPWHEPRTPDVPGLDAFPGPVFHSSRWDHDVDLTGLRVAVVGSGASAVQFVPEIQPSVAELHLYQRTAQWVLPKPDLAVPRWVRRAFARWPATMRATRAAQYGLMEALGLGFRHPAILRQLQRLGLLHLRRQVRDAELRAALTPDYTIGCKRLLLSNDYLRALDAQNVTVHPTAVTAVDGRRVTDARGEVREVDAIVLATGFRILDSPIAGRVHVGGRSLQEHWAGSPGAYLGTTVSGFPNFFLMLGPTLGTGHSSAFTILEAQLRQIAQAVPRILRRPASVLDVRPEVQDAYIDEVQAALPHTVYAAGTCASYYVDENGRNSFSWPWSTGRLVRRVGTFDPGAYDETVASGQPCP